MKEQNGIVRFIFFTATRTFGTIVDVGVVWLLTDFVFENYFLVNVVSPTISFEMAGYCIKLGVLNLLKLTFGWHTALCNFIALAVAGIFNYLIADKWVFKKIRYEEDENPEIEQNEEICK